MIFATTETSDYYKLLVKTQRRDWFLSAMFLPEREREAAIAIYCLDIELEHVGHVVKEEMIGHIRYAWWHENIEGLSDKNRIRDHPVLKALANLEIGPAKLLPLVAVYSEYFPAHPENSEELAQDTLRQYLGKHYKKWEKATKIIAVHRKKYVSKNGNWLLVKLLFV